MRRRLVRAFARTKPLVPDRAWPLLLSMRSAVGSGPLIAEPALRRVVVLAAHPDDESLGCAGTIALLREAGAQITVAFATDGEATVGTTVSAEETGRLRRGEAISACATLGVEDVRFWALPDGGLPTRIADLGHRLGLLLGETHPDGLFLPWFLDGHPDHEALGAALADVAPGGDLEVWGYETWTPLPANRLVDVTAVWNRKEAALAAHVTAALAFDVTAGLGINRWRSLQGLMGRGYAEGFLVAPAPEWIDLRAKLAGP